MPIIITDDDYTATPPTRSCINLRADVASYVLATENPRALAKADDFLRDAVDEVNTHNWHFALVSQDITLVAGQRDYDLTQQFRAPQQLSLLNAQGRVVGALGFETMKIFELRLAEFETTGGIPFTYTCYNQHDLGTMTIDVAPSAGFIASYPTARLWYYKRVQPCSTENTSLDVPPEVASFIVWRAKEMMAAAYDMSKVGYAAGRANSVLRDLRRSNMQTQLTDWSEAGR